MAQSTLLLYLVDGCDRQRARLSLLSSTLRRFLDSGLRATVLEIADGVPMVLSQLAVSVSRAVHLLPSLHLECSRQVQVVEALRKYLGGNVCSIFIIPSLGSVDSGLDYTNTVWIAIPQEERYGRLV
jgi:hypothetical protein